MELRRLAKRIGRSVQAQWFLFASRSQRVADSPAVRVLCYHSVPASEAASFRRQLEWLARRYEVVAIEKVLECLLGEPPAACRRAAITFDDGFRDNFDVAAPVLRQLGLPAAFFVVTSSRAGNAAERHDAPDAPDERWPVRLFMTWDEVRQLSDDGFEIGLHAHVHRDQARFMAAELRSDLANGIELIRQHIGRRPKHFAWPFGRAVNRHPQLTTILGSLGISCAFSGVAGNNLPGTCPYFLYRDSIDPAWPTHLVEALLAGMLDQRLAS
ncbi:MAG: polysaccharide deacetylase family protein [Planctomycetes bacterium]|nr:polysaccharide deacetylase family protein [Planctomycetota bacterium]